MRCKRRARGIPDLPTSSTDYSSKSAPARSKMMAVSSSWGRAASRPHRTRGGPSDPSISERGLEKALGRRRAGQRGDDVDAAAVTRWSTGYVKLYVYARGSKATRFPPSVADAYMAAMHRTTSNPSSASMPRKCSRPRHALMNAWTLSGPVPVSS